MLEHDVNRIEKFSNCICRSLHCHCSQGTFCWVSTSTSLTPFWVAHATKGPRHRTQLIGPSPKWSVACFASWNGRITGKSKIWKYQIKQWNQTESTCFGTGAKYAADVVLVTTYTSFCLCQIFPVHARYWSRCSCDCLKMPCKVYMSGNLDCAGLQKKVNLTLQLLETTFDLIQNVKPRAQVHHADWGQGDRPARCWTTYVHRKKSWCVYIKTWYVYRKHIHIEAVVCR